MAMYLESEQLNQNINIAMEEYYIIRVFHEWSRIFKPNSAITTTNEKN